MADAPVEPNDRALSDGSSVPSTAHTLSKLILYPLVNGREPWTEVELTEVLADFAAQAHTADFEAAIVEAQELAKAIRLFESADTELRRAITAGTQPRLSDAGTRYAIAKSRVFKAALSLDDPTR